MSITPKKRAPPLNGGLSARARRRKFRSTSSDTVRRSDLINAHSGILISCTPHHEKHAFRDAVVLFSRYLEQYDNKTSSIPPPITKITSPDISARANIDSPAAGTPVVTENKPEKQVNPLPTNSHVQPVLPETSSSKSQEPASLDKGVSDPPRASHASIKKDTDSNQVKDSSSSKPITLDEELSQLRDKSNSLLTRIEAGVQGSIFLRINNESIDIESVVKQALLEARQSGNPGSRHCIRLIPVFSTCYAKPQNAADAALKVVKARFPAVEKDKPVSFAIVFRARLNTSAKRDDFIKVIADAIHNLEPRYTVNLSKPDVVLIVEILKTSCCIGAFKGFYQLSKLNLREAACPTKPKGDEHKKQNSSADVAKEKVEKDASAVEECAGVEKITPVHEKSSDTKGNTENSSEQVEKQQKQQHDTVGKWELSSSLKA